jgi:hypothetical protein
MCFAHSSKNMRAQNNIIWIIILNPRLLPHLFASVRPWTSSQLSFHAHRVSVPPSWACRGTVPWSRRASAAVLAVVPCATARGGYWANSAHYWLGSL